MSTLRIRRQLRGLASFAPFGITRLPPHGAQGPPNGAQGTPHDAQGLPKDAQGLPDGVQGSPKGRPRATQERPGTHWTLQGPCKVLTKPSHGQQGPARPDWGQATGSRALTGPHQARIAQTLQRPARVKPRAARLPDRQLSTNHRQNTFDKHAGQVHFATRR